MKLTILKQGDRFDIGRGRGLFSASGVNVAKELDEFLDYFKKAKLGEKPNVMRISRKQAESMQWNPIAKKEGDRAEVRRLDLYFNDIPVKVGSAA